MLFRGIPCLNLLEIQLSATTTIVNGYLTFGNFQQAAISTALRISAGCLHEGSTFVSWLCRIGLT